VPEFDWRVLRAWGGGKTKGGGGHGGGRPGGWTRKAEVGRRVNESVSAGDPEGKRNKKKTGGRGGWGPGFSGRLQHLPADVG